MGIEQYKRMHVVDLSAILYPILWDEQTISIRIGLLAWPVANIMQSSIYVAYYSCACEAGGQVANHVCGVSIKN